jgi:molecular chaperone DnaK (HSP70)
MERGLYRTVPGHVVELFKAGLDEREIYKDSRRQIEETLAALPFPKSVDEVTTDFLVKILQHIKSRLEALPYHSNDLVHLTITVPAMWTLRSRRRTIKAVEHAAQVAHLHFTKNIYLCLEPEAAAAYVFRHTENIPWKVCTLYMINSIEITLHRKAILL